MVGDKIQAFNEYYKRQFEAINQIMFDPSFESVSEILDDMTFMEKYTSAFREYFNGGKRLRAILVVLGYTMCGNAVNKDIILASLSYELFQNGVLIHDDIIDKSDLRRNKASMHIRLGDNWDGISKAICIGDLGIVSALDTIAMTEEFDSNKKIRALVNQNKVYKLTVAGELKDIELSEERKCTLSDVIVMYELKTSWYSFIGPLQLGLILGGADDNLIKSAEEFGRFLGIAFQIKDDISGIYGKSTDTGKSSVTDIEEGKNTVLTCYYRSEQSKDDVEKIKIFDSIYGTGVCNEQILKHIHCLFDEVGVRDYAEELCKKYIGMAVSIIDDMTISTDIKDILYGLVEYLKKM